MRPIPITTTCSTMKIAKDVRNAMSPGNFMADTEVLMYFEYDGMKFIDTPATLIYAAAKGLPLVVTDEDHEKLVKMAGDAGIEIMFDDYVPGYDAVADLCYNAAVKFLNYLEVGTSLPEGWE